MIYMDLKVGLIVNYFRKKSLEEEVSFCYTIGRIDNTKKGVMICFLSLVYWVY